MTMNMSAQGDRHVSWQVGGTDDVGAEAEGEVARTTGRTLDTLMKAEHVYQCSRGPTPARCGSTRYRSLAAAAGAHIRRCVLASRSGEHLRKPTTNIVCVREPDERHPDSACVEHDTARSIEHVQPLMDRKQRIGDAATFVIARNEQDRHSRRGKTLEWGERRLGQPCWYTTSVQQVAAVDDDIDFPSACWLQGALEILKEVIAASTSNDARPCRPIQTDVRV
jgi:hypothetical protein